MAGPQPNGRNSEGVVTIRHPRSDFPQQGWQAKPVLTLYEAVSGFGWYAPTQSYRSGDKSITYGRHNRFGNRAFYQTEPARVYTSTLPAAYDPALANWAIPSSRTKTNPSRLFEHWDQDDQNFDFITFAAAFDPATQNWSIDTSRMLGKDQYRARRDTSIPFIPLDVSTNDWQIPASRPVSPIRSRLDTQITSSWIFPNLPAVFDPSLQIWTIQSHRPALRARYAWHAYNQPWTPYLLLKPWLFRSHTHTMGSGFQSEADT